MHEPRGAAVLVPLGVLALLSIVAGFAETPAGLGHVTAFSDFLSSVLPSSEHAGSFALEAAAAAASLAGIVLAAAWWFFLQASQRSLGVVGAFFILAGFATFFWLLSWAKIFTPGSSAAVAHLTLIVVALILGIGLSWSRVKRRVTGQVDTDQVG